MLGQYQMAIARRNTARSGALANGDIQIPLVTSPPKSNTEGMKVRCNELIDEEADYEWTEFLMLRGRGK